MTRWMVLLCIACAPSAFLAWRARDVPQLGSLQDDAIYFSSAKSLAEGHGYRIPSLPGAPAQTKYPPAYPWLLSLVWRTHPQFPQNLPWAALAAWIMLPVLVGLAWLRFRRMGMEPSYAAGLCVLIALNAHVVWFALNLMPELAFVSTLLACTLLADGDRDGWGAAAAGLLGGLAYLLKTSALPLLATTPLLFLARRRYRQAILFAIGMAPAVIAWTVWTRAHHAPPGDSTWTFYTNYLAYQALNIPLHDYPMVIWVNLRTLAASLGELVAVPEFGGMLGKAPAYLCGAAAVGGAILLARRKGFTHYHAFALGLIPMLAVWHYPPIPRFAMSLLPLLLAGLAAAVMEAGRRAPPAGLAMAALLAPVAIAAVYGGPLPEIYRLVERARSQRAALANEYRWVAEHTPAGAGFAASDDAVFYLHTGRPAIALHIPPKMLYHEDRRGMAREYAGMQAFAARNHLSYLFRTDRDFDQDFIPGMGREILDRLLADPARFRLLHQSGAAAVYKVGGAGYGTGEGVALSASNSQTLR